MLDIFRDLIYLMAGLATIYQYRAGDGHLIEAVVSYSFIAILFQLFTHILECVITKDDKEKTPSKNILIIIISFVLSFIITNYLIPIPI